MGTTEHEFDVFTRDDDMRIAVCKDIEILQRNLDYSLAKNKKRVEPSVLIYSIAGKAARKAWNRENRQGPKYRNKLRNQIRKLSEVVR